MKAGLRDPSLEALQNGLSAQTRPKSDRQRGRLAVTTLQTSFMFLVNIDSSRTRLIFVINLPAGGIFT